MGGTTADMRSGDDAMTRSEEQMHVGVERQEVGRARLRKYVVTEEQQQTIPVRHEEVRVVREPITDADMGDALSGPEISEAEREVTLFAETPVVETRAEPVERVRLSTEEVTEEETVTGTVRKERIETDFGDDEEAGRT
ncbi:YsnF/AvaK domain-containing protein [Streptomyces sp. NPDC059271]|uniref:YsnF/AvaK domain-containing protein n=1 Tax=unclassified Streptomyces TaxID=2593676 RepID=UPI00365EC4BC